MIGRWLRGWSDSVFVVEFRRVSVNNCKHTEEAKRAMSDAKKKWHEQNRDVMRGDNHPLWGRRTSDEVKKYKARVAAANSKAVRGFKMFDPNASEKEFVKVSYDNITDRLVEGWMFKSSRLIVNNGVEQRSIYPKDYMKVISEGWKPGSLPQIKF